MADALVAIDNSRLPAYESEYIAFRANRHACPATDAIVLENLWMLCLRPIRKQRPSFRGLSRFHLTVLVGAPVANYEKPENSPGD
jgi:hypothetical protein